MHVDVEIWPGMYWELYWESEVPTLLKVEISKAASNEGLREKESSRRITAEFFQCGAEPKEAYVSAVHASNEYLQIINFHAMKRTNNYRDLKMVLNASLATVQQLPFLKFYHSSTVEKWAWSAF